MIETINLTKRYDTSSGAVVAASDISLTVRPGELVSVTGPSGCGKSTLLALLAGIIAPTAGAVHIDGDAFSELPPESRAGRRLRNIGMVFQDDRLIPEFTVIENVRLPLELQRQPHDLSTRTALEALRSVGIDDLQDRYPSQLSGGQRQRVGIARAVVGDRTIILADEATGALDRRNSAMIFDLLRALADQGHVVIAATHDTLIDEYAHRNVQMIDGAITLDTGVTVR